LFSAQYENKLKTLYVWTAVLRRARQCPRES
jgi:hypothetical protein